ncbi:hypothetical protein Drorol1_Dr00018001 [Drosera rotundifolia]
MAIVICIARLIAAIVIVLKAPSESLKPTRHPLSSFSKPQPRLSLPQRLPPSFPLPYATTATTHHRRSSPLPPFTSSSRSAKFPRARKPTWHPLSSFSKPHPRLSPPQRLSPSFPLPHAAIATAHHHRSSPLLPFTSSSRSAKFPRTGVSLNGVSRSIAARCRWTSSGSPLSSSSLSSAGSRLDGVSNQPVSSSRGSSLAARLGQPRTTGPAARSWLA